MHKVLFYILVVTLVVSTQLTGQQKLQPTETQIDELFGGWTEDTKPGIALAVLNDGKIEFQKNWGLANLEHQIPIDNQTVFHFPIMSEQMLIYCILTLKERRQLSLEEKIGNYIKELPLTLQSITIEELVHHTSTLSSLDNLKVIYGWSETDNLTKSELDKLLHLSLAHKANDEKSHNYNQAGLRLLQLVLEEQVNMSFGEFVQKEIFDPLGMKHSYIAPAHQTIRNKAQGYIAQGEEFRLAQNNNNYLVCDQLYTTTKDLCLWEDNFWRPKIGKPATWKQMDLFVTDKGQPKLQKNLSLYIGHHKYWNYNGTNKLYQVGMSEGYAAKVVRFPEHDLAIVVMGNFGQYNGHLASACSELYLEPFFDKEGTSTPKPTFVKASNKQLNKHCGQYWDYEGESMVTVTLENDTLRHFDELYNWKPNLLPLGGNKYFIDERSGFYVEFQGENLVFSNSSGRSIAFTKIPYQDTKNKSVNDYDAYYLNTELPVRYEIKGNKEGLLLNTSNGITIQFHPMGEDVYRSTSPYISRLNFQRNNQNKISSLKVSSRLFKDILFFKTQKTLSEQSLEN